jgi:hypothetical protein
MRPIHSVTIIAGAAMLFSCAHSGTPSVAAGGAQRPSASQNESMMNDQYEAPQPRDTVPKVMQAKLAHAQAVLEGIAMADYAQIESNAMALKRISQGGDWLVHESATYLDFSTEFREICDDLVTHAHAQNLQAVALDYGHLANSCVACHSYLRMERQTRDMPGRVSMGP